MARSTQASTFHLSQPWQLGAIIAVILSWLVNFAYLALGLSSGYMSAGTIVFQITMSLVPILWSGLALWLVWNRFKRLLQRIFAACVIGEIGFAAYSSLGSMEQILRIKLYPPTITQGDTSWLTAFGHEWLVAGIGLMIFTAAIAFMKYRAGKASG
jgi:hypothetical protein